MIPTVAGTRSEAIKAAIQRQLKQTPPTGMPQKWDGQAAVRIVEVLVDAQQRKLQRAADGGH